MKCFIVTFVTSMTFPLWGTTPYSGSPMELSSKPGSSTTIEAECYDKGFDNDAFHDLTPENEGGVYRLDEVDIYKSEKGNIYLGSFLPGEWTGYSVKNPEEGKFDIEINSSSAFEAASIIFEVAGKDLPLPVPYSGDWDSWRRSTLMGVEIPKGSFQIKLKTNTGNFYIDSFRLIRRPR